MKIKKNGFIRVMTKSWYFETPTRVEIGEVRVNHRDPQRLPLADGMPGLDVVAPGTLFLNYPIGEVHPRLDFYGSGLAW